MYTPETQSLINTFKQKAIAGTLTQDEMKQAVLIMRQERATAAMSPAGKKRGSTNPARPVDDLLAELGGVKTT